jgi:hypothetical protein
MIAALYVETGGVYFGLEDVDPWDEERDARLYAGPWPVVAHPPCNRWSLMAQCRGMRDGEDDGCFEAALDAVRTFGGVLEHPAHSLAWERFGLPIPCNGGWSLSLIDLGCTTEVDQRHYGMRCRKPTWLYYVGPEPYDFIWNPSDRGERVFSPTSKRGEYANTHNNHSQRSRTPPAFRDVLLDMARSAGRVPVGTPSEDA